MVRLNTLKCVIKIVASRSEACEQAFFSQGSARGKSLLKLVHVIFVALKSRDFLFFEILVTLVIILYDFSIIFPCFCDFCNFAL